MSNKMNQFKRKISSPDGLQGTAVLQTKVDHRGKTAYKTVEIECGQYGYFLVPIPENLDREDQIERLIIAFTFYPEWREAFRIITATHPKTNCLITKPQGATTSVPVDHLMAPYIQALNDQGYPTLASSQGDDHPYGRLPYLRFAGAMPNDLEAVWSRCGWLGVEPVVTPTACHGYHDHSRRLFFLLLDDWFHHSLDLTAKRYLFSRAPLPRVPDIPAFTGKALSAYQAFVSKSAQRLNQLGPKASFQQMLEMRAGRDTYSNWKEDKLREALSNDPLLPEIELLADGDIPALQRALRWRLRGLDLWAIKEKLRIDKAFQTRKAAKEQNQPS